MIYSNSITKSFETLLSKAGLNVIGLGNVGKKRLFFTVASQSEADAIIAQLDQSRLKWKLSGQSEVVKCIRTGQSLVEVKLGK